MGFFRKDSIVKRKDGRLVIGKKEKRYNTENYYGRFFVGGKQVSLSAKTTNKKKAITTLEQYYEDYQAKKRLNLIIHSKSVKDCWEEYKQDLKKGTSLSGITLRGYLQKGKLMIKHIGHLKVDRLTYDDVTELLSRRNSFNQNKTQKLRQATLEGDLRAFSKFDTWLVEKGYKKKKLIGLKKKIIGKNKEDTSRLYFKRQEYQKLLSVSKGRIQKAEQGGLDGGKKVAFQRKLLHQFIIFAVNTGIRVGGILNLKWEDVQLRDKKQDYFEKGIKKNYGDDFYGKLDRYYTINNVTDKSGYYKNIGLGGSYFAIKAVQKLYDEKKIIFKNSEKIFNVKSFSVGFNSLLDETNLKKIKIGDNWLRRDSVSLRHTYIVFMLENGFSEFSIGKNVNTSGEMIHKHYTKNLLTTDMVEQLTGIGTRRNLRLISV
jgi:integrase